MQCLLGQVKFAGGAPSGWTTAEPLIASRAERCRDGSLEHLCGQFVVLRATPAFPLLPDMRQRDRPKRRTPGSYPCGTSDPPYFSYRMMELARRAGGV